MIDSLKYQGNELELFQHAKNWKSYFAREINSFILGDVLEVGAGLGATTLLLNNGQPAHWLLLEPDIDMCAYLTKRLEKKELPANCKLITGTIEQVFMKFDTIIYIDVLEHIEKDSAEIEKASMLLKKSGHLIVLSPAHEFLYNRFDKEIGHHRRYSKKDIKNLGTKNLKLVQNRYLDSIGFFAALLNKILFHQKYPTLKQVLFWDQWMIPVSRISDKIFFHSFGKSLLSIWQKL